MSGRLKNRGSTSCVEQATTTVNERILKECHTLYLPTDSDLGLVAIAETLGLKLLAPRKKITIMLIGNHSAGKSSFINWYIEEHVQRTGVAIETQGFSFVTSGRRRESLTGNATLHLYPHFKPLQQMPGVVDYLQTEISTSKQKKFPLVTFLDTPGLVDGDMNYPFDVNEAITWLAELSDLIFVFFDPIGQALCKRTLNIVEALSEKHSERMRFYLSKADEAGHESDRQRVMMQIVQELCKRPGLNRTGFDMPTIYIPNPNKPSRCVNQIEEVCRDVEKTINQTIQNTLNSLEKDCDRIGQLVDEAIHKDNMARSANIRAYMRGGFLYLLTISLPLIIIINIILGLVTPRFLVDNLGEDGAKTLELYIAPVRTFWSGIYEEYQAYAVVFLAGVVLLLLLAAKIFSRTVPTLTRKQKRQLLDKQEYVANVVKTKKKSLYSEYLQQTVSDHDL
jgi:GTPase SAR1 family protein